MTVMTPRAGIAGVWDRFVGPGSTPAEQALIGLTALCGAVAQWVFARHVQPDGSLWVHGLAAVLMFDVLGGIVTNATVSARRWFHRPGQTARWHVGFVAMHGLHLAVVAAVFRDGDGLWFTGVYGALLASALLVLMAPGHLKRPVSLALVSGAMVADALWLSPSTLVPWFLPLLFLKLLYSHLVPD